MAETRPRGEQIRFESAKTGSHNLDTYLEACELGTSAPYKTLPALIDELFTSAGDIDPTILEFQVDHASRKLQVRFGHFASSSTGWSDINQWVFNQRGAHANSTAYKRLDVVTYNNGTYICSVAHTSASAVPSATEFITCLDGTALSTATTSASTSATAAAASETAAAASETAAATSATDSATSATASAGSATTSAGSATASASSATASATSATLSADWATETSSAVSGGEFSAKEYAQGTQASTGGSSKSWSQDADQVDGASTNDRSAKAWAQGASMTGATLGGSSKDWAQLTGTTVDGTNYSAKYHATAAATSETNAATSAATATTQANNASASATAAAASAASISLPSVSGQAGKILQVNAGATGYDHVTISSVEADPAAIAMAIALS